MATPRRFNRLFASLLAAFSLLAAACGSSAPDESTATQPPRPTGDLVDSRGRAFLEPPEVLAGDLSPEIRENLDKLFSQLQIAVDRSSTEALGRSGDVRVGWLLADLMRFTQTTTDSVLATSFTELTGVQFDPSIDSGSVWGQATNALLAWDIPAPPDYLDWKRIPFELVEPKWAPFFDAETSVIDWRIYSWGGVLIDDRTRAEADEPCLRSCIPALNDPQLTDADGGGWYDDDSIVFGVVVNNEAVAFPKNIMEVHEMVNTTIGGRRLGIPY